MGLKKMKYFVLYEEKIFLLLNEDFAKIVVHVLMLIDVDIQDDFAFLILVELNVEDVFVFDIQDIPIKL